MQLIQRFYDPISYDENGDRTIAASPDDEAPIPDDGVVTIDDKAMRQLDVRWIRNHIGYVGQEPILFNDTIFNNIALGKPNCTIEEVEQAAKHANAYDFIVGLEDGFSTVVGAGGGKISGGQKQRVAIARGELSPAVRGARLFFYKASLLMFSFNSKPKGEDKMSPGRPRK